jgi:hypothetical protein
MTDLQMISHWLELIWEQLLRIADTMAANREDR